MRRPRRLRFVPRRLSVLIPAVQPALRTEVSLSLNPPLKAVTTTSSCCFSMIWGVVEKIRKAVSRCAASCDWLAWKRAPSSSGHATPVMVRMCSHFLVRFQSPSSVCWRASSATASPILPRTELSVSLARQESSLARIASRSGALRVRKRSTVPPEAAFRGFEDWRLKMTAANVRVCGTHERWNQVRTVQPTEVSCASSICSERPIKSTSGLWATHSSFSCVSAFVRWMLSGDCRPCSRLASAVCTSAGRTDILAVCVSWSWGGPGGRGRCSQQGTEGRVDGWWGRPCACTTVRMTRRRGVKWGPRVRLGALQLRIRAPGVCCCEKAKLAEQCLRGTNVSDEHPPRAAIGRPSRRVATRPCSLVITARDAMTPFCIRCITSGYTQARVMIENLERPQASHEQAAMSRRQYGYLPNFKLLTKLQPRCRSSMDIILTPH
jgi:hypothetical protein